jgi:hypothetical protein
MQLKRIVSRDQEGVLMIQNIEIEIFETLKPPAGYEKVHSYAI